MTEILTVTPNWLEDQRPSKADKLKAVKDLTAGCPCDTCVGWSTCQVTGHECRRFLDWVQRPTTGEKK